MKSTRNLDVSPKEFNFTKLPPASWLGIKNESSALGFNIFAFLECAALLYLLENSIQSFESGYLIPAPYEIPAKLILVSIWPTLLGYISKELASIFIKPSTESDHAIDRRHHQFFSAPKSITDALNFLPSRLLGVKDTSVAIAVNTFVLADLIAFYYAIADCIEHQNMGILIAHPGDFASKAYTATVAAALGSLFVGAMATIFIGSEEKTSAPRPR